MEFRSYHGCPGLVFDSESRFMQAARRAIADAFGAEPVMIREGGSIPVVGTFRDVLGVDTLLLGWGQNSDNLHSPNEHFTLADFHRGTRATPICGANWPAGHEVGDHRLCLRINVDAPGRKHSL